MNYALLDCNSQNFEALNLYMLILSISNCCNFVLLFCEENRTSCSCTSSREEHFTRKNNKKKIESFVACKNCQYIEGQEFCGFFF